MEIPAVSLQRPVAFERANGGQKSGGAASALELQVAKYINPRMSYDPATGRIVVQIRDSETGEVREQYRPDTVARAYVRGDGGRNASPPADQPAVTPAAPEPAAEPSGEASAAGAGATLMERGPTVSVIS
jgi:hypothetical protein